MDQHLGGGLALAHHLSHLRGVKPAKEAQGHGFGLLGDTNTENPLVIDAFKDSYRYWIEEVGVDGYRMDTVIYVDPPFWHQFLHDDDGIYPSAAATGR